MKVFLSWSGGRSREVAAFLHDWLRDVIQAVKPWYSKKDIAAGKRWDAEISTELSECHFGIVCLTPENSVAPWIMFEAGALAKSLAEAQVVPYLIDMDESGIGSTPLASFQAKRSDQDGTKALLEDLNAALPEGSRLSVASLERQFGLHWPRLEKMLKELPARPLDAPKPPATDEIVKEILSSVRGLMGTADETKQLLTEVTRAQAQAFLHRGMWTDYPLSSVLIDQVHSGSSNTIAAVPVTSATSIHVSSTEPSIKGPRPR